jgi:alkaline phosphatase D
MRFPVTLTAVVLASFAAAATHAGDAKIAGMTLSVGDVFGGAASVIANAHEAGARLTLELATDPGFASVVRSQSLRQADALVPAKAFLSGLELGTRYYVRVKGDHELRTATFVAGASEVGGLGADLTGTRFGVSGDWRGDIGLFNGILNADERSLDFFVKLGDTIYADVPSPAVPNGPAQTLEEFRAKHVENYAPRYGIDPWGDLAASTSTFAMIDDHEVTNDFDGGAFDPVNGWYNEGSLYRNGLQAFVEHNPVFPTVYSGTGDPRVDGRPMLYRSFQWGRDASVFILDNRSFRDASLPPVANPFDPAQVLAFLTASFDPTRTMLGYPQLAQLLSDLATAQRAGVVWKFIMTPEPIQNFGPLAGEDRWEGYAAERAFILGQVAALGIRNVVFITADFHGTIVNDVTMPNPANPAQQLYTGAFEVITGSVAYSAPAGPTFAQLGLQTGALTSEQFAYYQSLPTAAQDAFVQQLLDNVIAGYGYSATGIQDPSIDAQFLVGGPVAAHHYGWTEFEVDGASKALTITTYGVDWYSPAEVQADPFAILARPITVRQQFRVGAVLRACPGPSDLNGDSTVNAADLGALLSQWGTKCLGPCAADLNGDGEVDGGDLGILLNDWSDCD